MTLLLPAVAVAKPSSTPFAIEPGSFRVTPSTFQAGAHPDLTIAFDFAHSAEGRPFNDVKDTVIDLPPGFAGRASAAPTCAAAQLIVEAFKPECPLDSQVGTVSIVFTIGPGASPMHWTLPLFNMQRSGLDTPAQLGFKALFLAQLVPMSLRPTDSGLTVDVSNIPIAAEPSRLSLTIWGVPAAPSHDSERGRECTSDGEEECPGGGNPANVPARPFLVNPTRCGAATARLEADSWEAPGTWSQAQAEAGPIVECDRVPFQPALKAKATSRAADSPTGLDLSILMPQDAGDPEALASSSLAIAEVTLPEGLSINPASAPAVCTREEFERETAPPAREGGCPAGSAVGTVEVETPLVDETALGSVYLAKPFDNPLGSLLGLYVVARAPGSGAFIRLAGRLLPDPRSGRLRIEFGDVPQLPLSRFTLHLPQREGSLLVTPPACGTYEVAAELTPSSDPTAARHAVDRFEIDRGSGGGSCPDGKLPFHPDLSLDSPKKAAGAFSPLRLRLRREDGEGQVARLALRLPSGLIADLVAVPICPEAALASASAKTGAEERADPSCPTGSALGRTLVAAGVGSQLASVRGSVYLAGPFDGAPLSLAVVAPALLGPFDLGTVVVRAALRLDRRTGEILIGSRRSDPIPLILSGIPLHLRTLDVFLNRTRFLRNPTGCGPLQLTGKLTPAAGSSAGALETPLKLPVAFPVEDCTRLRFAPRLRLGFQGGVHRNGHPGLRIVLASRRRESGLASAAIELPHTELLDPGHIRGICTPQRLEERRCPADSVYGFAKALTPLLAEPLKGPVYLRSTGHGLPSLAAALHSRRMDFDLIARLEPMRGGIRLALEDVPDLPISKLVLETKGGKDGILVNSVDLCARPRRALARLTAHSGKRHRASLPAPASCEPHDRGARRGRLDALGRRGR